MLLTKNIKDFNGKNGFNATLIAKFKEDLQPFVLE